MHHRSDTKRVTRELSEIIDRIGRALSLKSVTISEAKKILSEVISRVRYVRHIEFGLALLYYASRIHEPFPLSAMTCLWSLHCDMVSIRTRHHKRGERSALRKLYKHVDKSIAAKYYKDVALICGNQRLPDYTMRLVLFIEEFSSIPYLAGAKRLAKELAKRFPPEKHDRNLILLAMAYLYVACRIQGKRVTERDLANLSSFENAELTNARKELFQIGFLLEEIIWKIYRKLEVGLTTEESNKLFHFLRHEFWYSLRETEEWIDAIYRIDEIVNTADLYAQKLGRKIRREFREFDMRRKVSHFKPMILDN